MEKRVELSLLMDFYGPLLTQHRREVVRLYCDEDLSLQEIADQMGISRQGAHDALKAASAQLMRFETILGLADRYQKIGREIKRCRALLGSVSAEGEGGQALREAMAALDRIDGIER